MAVRPGVCARGRSLQRNLMSGDFSPEQKRYLGGGAGGEAAE
jgi:hypothetical protein